MTVAILVPVLGRPHRVKPLVDSIAASTTVPYRVLFLVSPHDALEVEAIERENAELWAVSGNYAKKINDGVGITDEPYLFLGADDLDFQPGWFEAASRHLNDHVGVVGVNDLIEREREHTTHFLMARWYAEAPTIDGERGPVQEAYTHWFCDDELIATAKKRNAYAYAADACVEHLHPMNGKADDDETYRLGRQNRRRDRNLFLRRQQLWM